LGYKHIQILHFVILINCRTEKRYSSTACDSDNVYDKP
jgi:hypothetical protein